MLEMLWGWSSKGESWRPARVPVIMYDSDLECQHRKRDPILGTRHSGSLTTEREGSPAGAGVQECLSELSVWVWPSQLLGLEIFSVLTGFPTILAK